MLMRLVLIVILSIVSIFIINYTGYASLEYTPKNILYASIFIIVATIIYKILIRFLKLFLFVVIVVPVLFICYYYLYTYITGAPQEFMQF